MTESKSDLFEQSLNLGESKRIYTISEITQDIKLILESTLGEVWVEGEVSNFSSKDGHFYFVLKDSQGILPAVMFARANKGIKFKIENGLKLICFGKISAYAPHGKYQIIIEKIEPKGMGSLQLALEQLKEKLEKEGLFVAEHKRPMPYLPSKIGVVTSLSGAAIRDILKVLERRFGDVHIIINPAQVQGEAAKEEIAQAIKDFNLFNEKLPDNERIEVMIVGRGGGSIEDLWAFNEEIVARAIYNSKIPVISAVGHERDWTIADMVADLRAPTPSVAAELVVPKKEDLKEKLSNISSDLKRSFLEIAINFQEAMGDFNHRLNLSIGHIFELSKGEFESLVKKLALLNPALSILQRKEKIENLARQIYVRLGHFMKLRESEFTNLVEKLAALSPLNILGRGYSITFKMPEEAIVKEAKFIRTGDIIKTRLHRGEFTSRVTEVEKNG